ncbi:gfo/Idh/MocA family oxidoreductase [Candidatus Poribacteria bacterium]|nr:gfo/Idh/MocA family oxidoreductase [Candidatus Poribacteria bacterium]
MDKVGFGLIGTGLWGENHARTYVGSRDVDLKAICDLNVDRAKKIAGKYGVKDYYTDHNELLSRDDIEAVAIATPDFAHTELAVSAAKAGKHILIEKPLATSVEDCEKILSAVKDAGDIKFMVDFHNRWNPPFVNARTAIDGGELGKPMLMYVRLNDTIFVPTEMLSWASKSEVAWFVGSHAVDLTRWLFDDEVCKVYAVSRSEVLKSRGVDTPDFYEAILEFKNGGVATVENCWILPDSLPTVIDFKCQVIGSEGAMYMDLSSNGVNQKYTKNEASYPDTLVYPSIHGKPTGFAIESIRHFIDCVVNDKEPMVNGKDGLEATRIISAIQESSKKGEPVYLD